MKKLLFILLTYTFVLFISSCGNKSHDDHSGVHTHEDGDHEEHAKPEQESFEVGNDSTEAHDHDHDHEH